MDTEERSYEHFWTLLGDHDPGLAAHSQHQAAFVPGQSVAGDRSAEVRRACHHLGSPNCLSHQDYTRQGRVLVTEKVSPTDDSW